MDVIIVSTTKPNSKIHSRFFRNPATFNLYSMFSRTVGSGGSFASRKRECCRWSSAASRQCVGPPAGITHPMIESHSFSLAATSRTGKARSRDSNNSQRTFTQLSLNIFHYLLVLRPSTGGFFDSHSHRCCSADISDSSPSLPTSSHMICSFSMNVSAHFYSKLLL